MGLLEDALRDTFAAQVGSPPAVDDVAGRAVREAGSLRRRRTALTTVAVAVGVVLAGAGVVATAGPPQAPTVAAPGMGTADLALAAVSPPVDVLNGDRINRTDGSTVSLGPIVSSSPMAEARRAWRVDGGWLVETWDVAALTAAVWFLSEDGVAEKLADGERVAVGRGLADRAQVAWGSAGTVRVATVNAGRLIERRETAGTRTLAPISIVGAGVLVGGAPAGGGVDTYDMWFPPNGNYKRGPERRDKIIGVTGDESRLFGLVGGESHCLAIIAPVGLAPTQTRCGLGLGPDHRVYASPDGVWLAAIAPDRVDLFDLRTVWSVPTPTATWPIAASGAAWLADGSFVVGTRGAVVRLRTDDPTHQDTTVVPSSARASVMAIPDLRS